MIEKNYHDLEKGEYIDGPQAHDESCMYQNLADYSTIIEVNQRARICIGFTLQIPGISNILDLNQIITNQSSQKVFWSYDLFEGVIYHHHKKAFTHYATAANQDGRDYDSDDEESNDQQPNYAFCEGDIIGALLMPDHI